MSVASGPGALGLVQSQALRRDLGMAFGVALWSLGSGDVATPSPCAIPEARARSVCGESGRVPRDCAARLPQAPMAPPRPPRLLPALRALLYWSLVYGYCGLCASVHLLKLLWSIGRAPAQTFRRAARANPPACLNDPSLGTHCYVRIKVKAGAGLETGEGEGLGWELWEPRCLGRPADYS